MGTEPDDERPDGGPEEAGPESPPADRVHAAWRTWLSALAADAEAAMAAALAYESLPPEARDAWLDALEADGPTLDVPAVALYAPLLAVEAEGEPRRRRIEAAIAAAPALGGGPGQARALRGVGPDGSHACVIVRPLYLRFVQVLACRYTPAGGFIAVKHDPLRHVDAVAVIDSFEGISVEPTPLRIVIEELAHAILADKREQRVIPPVLASFAFLFAPDLDDREDGEPTSR